MGIPFKHSAKDRSTFLHKGRTIRKVKGGGGGEFLSRRNFFSLSNSLYEFFLGGSMNIFKG